MAPLTQAQQAGQNARLNLDGIQSADFGNMLQLANLELSTETFDCRFSDNLAKLLNMSLLEEHQTWETFLDAFTSTDQALIENAVSGITPKSPHSRLNVRLKPPHSGDFLLNIALDSNDEKILIFVQPLGPKREPKQSLAETFSLYERVVSGARDAVMMMSTQGDFLLGNQKAADLLEITIDDIPQLNLEKIHFPDEQDDIMLFYQQVIWGQNERIETTLLGVSGKTTPVELSARTLDVENQYVIAIVMRDITEDKQAQQNLMSSEQRYRSLVDEAREGIILLDWDGRIIASNPRLSETIGYSLSMLSGKVFDDIADFDLDISPIAIMRETAERHSIHTEGYLKTFTDELIPTGFNVARNETQGETQFIVTAYDLSEVRKGEEDRLQLQNQLFKTQKHELMGQLAGSLAHDFNNLLSPILLVSEMLMEDAEDAFMEKQLTNINQAAVRARRLVRRILDYTRPEESEKFWIDLDHELSETLALLRSSVPNTIEIQHQAYGRAIDCFADPDQIHQIIMNLGTNASQAIGEAGGWIKFELCFLTVADNDPYMIKYEVPEGQYVKLMVRDSGPGIPSENLEKIFEPFFTTKTQTDGSGIGLSIVQQIALNHEGFVEVENSANAGACISVYLPVEGEI